MAGVLCSVCNSEPKKYKCPTCSVPYCSISCFKEHKSTHPETAPTPSAPPEPEIPQPPPPQPLPKYLRKKIDFSILGTNPKFQELLKAYPTLLPMLQRIYAATIEPDPEDGPQSRRRGGYRGRGRGYRGGGRGGRGGWANDEGPRWTQKKGDADAMKMLKGLRDGKRAGEEKEAMTAFVGLVEETFGEVGREREEAVTGGMVGTL
ncbi:hypothetical protein BU26DRAFT_527061 [Trematosphaeria pertusa]|uniref:HIT-type domain-containing protein n=1 Tax=Trematosphaeria pertusa TaxID=390896 RepID=A0A6A6J1N9_9PLEO|nr:uncharacterized protein BU26DRAFT_527061 [Trematosphaeria pertusa]KAF2256785.1 hypothetical protein BU26DRAFT_527061 [Trematosphaeria pertusa]